MKLAAVKSELAFATLFAVVGLVWIVGSFELPFWAGFGPDSGFLPLIYGVLLVGLSLGVIAVMLTGFAQPAEREPLTKSFLVLGALAVSIGSVSVLGFALPLFGLMLFLYGYVERLPLVRAAIVSAVTTGVLALIFEHWLAIPLPLHPWDF